MSGRPGRARRVYGGPLWTLPVVVAPLLLTGYVMSKLISGPHHVRIFVWFAAAALLNDVLLFPAYALLDRLLTFRPRSTTARRPAITNRVRVPAALALLLLLIYAPTIFGRGDRTFRAASGLGPTDELERWLLLALALFAGSAAIYLLRILFKRSTRDRRHPSLPERSASAATCTPASTGRIPSDRGRQREH